MMGDELETYGDIHLVDEPPKHTASTSPAVVTQPAKQTNWLLIVIVACAFLWLYKSRDVAPGPKPGPDDQTIVIDDETKPQPVVIGDAVLLVVYESEDNDANFLSVYENKPYRDSLAARGMPIIWQDQDTINAKIKAEASQIGLPAVFVLSKADKKPITSFQLPEGGPTALDAELKKRVGK